MNDFKEALRIDPENIHKQKELIKKILKLNEKYYSQEYRELYKTHFLEEFLELKKHFPNIDFDYSGRFKAEESMKEKILRKIHEHKSGNVYDNFANKIIVYSVNNNSEEEILKQACFDIAEFITSYQSEISGEKFEELSDKRKDYISNSKESGYQAIHILRKHIKENTPSFLSETQIRTFRMEEQQKFGKASHANIYKKGKAISPSKCPIFLKISHSKKTGLYKVHELSQEESYNKYTEYITESANYLK